jgi:hypothetical protein
MAISTACSRNTLTDLRRFGLAALVGGAIFTVFPISTVYAQSSAAPAEKEPPASEFKQGVANPNARQVERWELGLRRFYGRQRSSTFKADEAKALRKLYRDPLAEKDPLAKMNRDPLLKDGFGNHPKLPQAPANSAPPAPVFDPGVARLDRNNDGSVSLDEYVRGRNRSATSGGAVSGRAQQQYREKLRSRFGFADQNGDGQVSPEELQGVSGARF